MHRSETPRPVVIGSGDLEIVSWDGRLALGMAAALLTANGLQYLFTIAMARLLEPADFGAIAALLALVLYGAVPGLALQAVAARHTARRSHARTALDGLWADTRRLVVLVTGALAAATLASAPLLQSAFSLRSPMPLLWLAACFTCLPLLSSLHGVLQGQERFRALGTVLVTGAALRLASGATLVSLGAGVTGAMAGVAVGYAAETFVALLLVGPAIRRSSSSRAGPHLTGEVVAAGSVILTMLAFANVDVLLARVFLPPAASGVYAVGAVFTKVAFWAPHFVTVTSFPRMAIANDHRPLLARALMLATAVGLAVVAGSALVAHVLVPVVFGDGYRSVVGLAWLFALLGALASLLNLLLQTGLARGTRSVGAALAGAIVVETLVIALWLHGSPGEVVAAACVVSATALSVAVFLGSRTTAGDRRSVHGAA